jgi:hypothetical protein
MRNPNKVHHIFANRRHNLGPLVRQYGSREAAAQAIQNAVDAALQAGELIPNARGVFEATPEIGGNQVTVRGANFKWDGSVGISLDSARESEMPMMSPSAAS